VHVCTSKILFDLPDVICATCVRDALLHIFINRDGFFWASCFTILAVCRSELPCRMTGLTALPKTLEYLALIAFSVSDSGSCGYSGTSYPFDRSSPIHASSCGMLALMFGNFRMLMLGSGVLHSFPKYSRLSATFRSFCAAGNAARTRPLKLMSQGTTSTLPSEENLENIGNKLYVASACFNRNADVGW